MEEINILSARVVNDKNIDGVRIDIVNLIARLLNEKRDTLTYWDKAWFAQAISAFNWNVRGEATSTAWLELSLVDLRNTLVPKDEQNENYVGKSKGIEELTFDQIMREIRRLGGYA